MRVTIQLIKGDEQFILPCTESLQDSELGKIYFPDKDKAESAIKEFVLNGNLLIAVDEYQTFTGFVCYLPTGAFHAFPYLHLLVTARTVRRKGIGTLIMDAFEELAFSQKDKLFLVVADFNTAGKKFYKKRNFVEIGNIPSLYRKGINECIMMKTNGK